MENDLEYFFDVVKNVKNVKIKHFLQINVTIISFHFVA